MDTSKILIAIQININTGKTLNIHLTLGTHTITSDTLILTLTLTLTLISTKGGGNEICRVHNLYSSDPVSSFQTKGTNDNNTTHPRSREPELAGRRWVGAAGEVSTEPGQQPYLYTPLHQTVGRPRQVIG